MYDTPILEAYGTLRELTLGNGNGGNGGGVGGGVGGGGVMGNHPLDNAKRPSVNDLATVFGPGGNTGCNLHAMPWSHAGNCSAISA